jgi:mannose-6-phosphate isomerase-like protein (cupin superfamily)
MAHSWWKPLTAALVAGCAIGWPVIAGDRPVTYIPGDETSAAFIKGRPLVETPEYKIHASRRDGPGQAEVHERDTDIFYVLDGSAVLVTGGAIVSPTPAGPGELRAPSIANGAARRLAKGDVVVVPNGTPHQFTEVGAAFLYYTVKVSSPPR